MGIPRAKSRAIPVHLATYIIGDRRSHGKRRSGAMCRARHGLRALRLPATLPPHVPPRAPAHLIPRYKAPGYKTIVEMMRVTPRGHGAESTRAARAGGARSGSYDNPAAGKASGKSAGFLHLLTEVWPFVRPQRWLLFLGFGLMAINRVAGLALPASTKFLVDNVVGKRQIQFARPPGARHSRRHRDSGHDLLHAHAAASPRPRSA